LARCNGCVTGGKNPNFAFVHEANSANAWAQWDVAYNNLPKLGSATIQADNGAYLKVCTSCGGAYPNAAAVQAGITAESKWQLIRVGKKVAIKGSNGNFLSRCNNCWTSGAYPDSAFVHLPNAVEPYSQWTAVKQASGKWTLQADTGKYLARCNNCATSTSPDLAFVHSTNPGDSWAQWTFAAA
jgi:transcription elongation factor Elf1